MEISATSSSNTATMSENSISKNNVLGQDAFFKLLITQLRYQDPLEPMKDQEFIAQLANFSSLEQVTNLNKQFGQMTTYLQDGLFAITSVQQATACLGNEIEYTDGDNVLTGKVDAVRIEGGMPILIVGDKRVDLANVLSIRTPESATTENHDSTDSLVEDEL